MKKCSTLICLVLLSVLLLSACNSSKTFDVNSATMIELANGTTGEVIEIKEAAQVQTIADMFTGKEFEKKESSSNNSGWSYRLTFFQDGKELKKIIVMSDSRIDYDGNFYDVKSGALDTSVFGKLLNN